MIPEAMLLKNVISIQFRVKIQESPFPLLLKARRHHSAILILYRTIGRTKILEASPSTPLLLQVHRGAIGPSDEFHRLIQTDTHNVLQLLGEMPAPMNLSLSFVCHDFSAGPPGIRSRLPPKPNRIPPRYGIHIQRDGGVILTVDGGTDPLLGEVGKKTVHTLLIFCSLKLPLH